MDKNTIYGLLLIGAILIGFSIYNSPSKDQLALQQHLRDSITAMAKIEQKEAQLKVLENAVKQSIPDSSVALNADSIEQNKLQQIYGVFYKAVKGDDKIYTLENELVKINISNKGGRVVSVELKKYQTYDSLPLILSDADSSNFAFDFKAQGRPVATSDFYFTAKNEPFVLKQNESKSFTMFLDAGEGKYIEYVYTLKGNSYLFDLKVNMVGMNRVISVDNSRIHLNWSEKTLHTEKYNKGDMNATTIYYETAEKNKVDYLTEAGDKQESIAEKTNWIGFKQQYFSSVLISKQGFESSELETMGLPTSQKYNKHLNANLTLAYNGSENTNYDFSYYYGPNHFQTLNSFNMNLEKVIPLGWGIMGWINKFAVIPVFNLLDSFNWNYGIIILALTLLIKLVLFPLTYKAYLSTAKMKVLKPEMDEINAKFATEDPMKKQQAVMELYRKAGVNPLGGCLPVVLQMPILFAMFKFFPASIELRHQGFLWATDLSTYDSIYNFGFDIPFYGDHISLFTLLMTVSTLLYTRMNNNQFSGNPQMESMKWIMYLMPIVFLGVFNNYSAGLSYYYFLANMMTFSQQYLIRKFVNEDEIHRKIQEHKKKPQTAKKSGFQAKLEEMSKLAQQRQEDAKKNKK
jgi:YidC/Oxa1 family membrane protein insertase